MSRDRSRDARHRSVSSCGPLRSGVEILEVVDLIKKSGVSRKEFSFFKSESEFMNLAAKTPRSNCVMTSAKLAGVGIRMTEVHEAIARDLARWQKAAA